MKTYKLKRLSSCPTSKLSTLIPSKSTVTKVVILLQTAHESQTNFRQKVFSVSISFYLVQIATLQLLYRRKNSSNFEVNQPTIEGFWILVYKKNQANFQKKLFVNIYSNNFSTTAQKKQSSRPITYWND